MQSDVISWFSSALPSLPIDPSGPGSPFERFCAARMLVRRSTSARHHSRISRSRVARSASLRVG